MKNWMHGYVINELESRLRMAEIEIKAGNVSAGRARLGQLQADARTRGFTLIARKEALPVKQ